MTPGRSPSLSEKAVNDQQQPRTGAPRAERYGDGESRRPQQSDNLKQNRLVTLKIGSRRLVSVTALDNLLEKAAAK